MLSVLVQVWGPANAMFGGYDWVTAGVIEEPESLDADYLKKEALRIINSRDYKPFTNSVRLIVKRDKAEMKVTLMDLW
ncbi:hypothetical protein HYU13_03800 [Candidatus Woesearchaeota archaeon]|nr:hypothetical protein [Candidatus Woesearchaeota archaeon]